MKTKVLIVEDEPIVGLYLHHTLSALGFQMVGIAVDVATADRLAREKPDFALIDVNLNDGATGPLIGRQLAEKHGVTVLFLTSDPEQLGAGIEGTVGVLSKPIGDEAIESALEFLVKRRLGETPVPPPVLRIFDNDNIKCEVADKSLIAHNS